MWIFLLYYFLFVYSVFLSKIVPLFYDGYVHERHFISQVVHFFSEGNGEIGQERRREREIEIQRYSNQIQRGKKRLCFSCMTKKNSGAHSRVATLQPSFQKKKKDYILCNQISAFLFSASQLCNRFRNHER